MDYKKQTKKAMEILAEDKRTIFMGQTVLYPGSPMHMSLENVPLEKKIEMPVAEDMQMGISIGLSLKGYIPISIYPRIDFLICGMNQLVNHLDKIKEMSHGEYNPKVIMRTQIGNTKPLYPGIQHCSDYTNALEIICKNIEVIKIRKAEDVIPVYKNALYNDKSTILVEVPTGGTKAQIEKYAELK